MTAEILTSDGAAARGIVLPTDANVANEVLEEVEAWLRQRIGPLQGDRTERFYVGIQSVFQPSGRLGLRRYTDEVSVIDSLTGATGQTGQAVDPDSIRLIGNGSVITRTYVAPTYWWMGPYVDVTYEPNDLAQVRGALYELLALSGSGPGSSTWVAGGLLDSERIGEYQYKTMLGTNSGSGIPGTSIDSRRAIIVDSILPARDQLATLYARQTFYPGDPVINRAELPT